MARKHDIFTNVPALAFRVYPIYIRFPVYTSEHIKNRNSFCITRYEWEGLDYIAIGLSHRSLLYDPTSGNGYKKRRTQVAVTIALT